MQGNKDVVNALNQVLTQELTSINQYFLHARIYANWGFEVLNKICYKKSIKDMKQADALIERILFLEGLPNLQYLDKLSIGEHAEEMLNCDLGFQQKGIQLLKPAIALCEREKDFISRDLLTEILEYEESHLDWIETQQSLIESMGIERYLQSQVAGE